MGYYKVITYNTLMETYLALPFARLELNNEYQSAQVSRMQMANKTP